LQLSGALLVSGAPEAALQGRALRASSGTAAETRNHPRSFTSTSGSLMTGGNIESADRLVCCACLLTRYVCINALILLIVNFACVDASARRRSD